MEKLSKDRAEELISALKYWDLSGDASQITKTYKFKDWQEAFAFTAKVSELAEAMNHHPDIDLHWGRVGVALSTHSVGGLSENDFILAAKIDALYG